MTFLGGLPLGRFAIMVAGRAVPAAAGGGFGFGVCSREEDSDSGGGMAISKRIVCYGVWEWGELRRRPRGFVRYVRSVLVVVVVVFWIKESLLVLFWLFVCVMYEIPRRHPII